MFTFDLFLQQLPPLPPSLADEYSYVLPRIWMVGVNIRRTIYAYTYIGTMK